MILMLVQLVEGALVLVQEGDFFGIDVRDDGCRFDFFILMNFLLRCIWLRTVSFESDWVAEQNLAFVFGGVLRDWQHFRGV